MSPEFCYFLVKTAQIKNHMANNEGHACAVGSDTEDRLFLAHIAENKCAKGAFMYH